VTPVQVVLVPWPVCWVAGSAFPRVIGHPPNPQHARKTDAKWPLTQQIPTQTRRILDDARRQLQERRERQLLRELEEQCP
jgi:hypothetical protein